VRAAEAHGEESAVDSGKAVDGAIRHPKVRQALQYIEEHIKEPGLTVGRIAEVLGITPTYLSQLFLRHTGEKMSRFIACRRVAMARHLLETTDWQVKRIAREAGFANPKWFFHVFGVIAGQTPSGYRRRSHGRGSSPQTNVGPEFDPSREKG
jgi:transcriptional regulator GlxA family with amidase domain